MRTWSFAPDRWGSVSAWLQLFFQSVDRNPNFTPSHCNKHLIDLFEKDKILREDRYWYFNKLGAGFLKG